MEYTLTPEEGRVLGCLLEKMMATPEYYPLSLNALINACNQKVNRMPVVSYDQTIVQGAIETLRQKQLVWINASGRVLKYREALTEHLELSKDQAAVVCILLLRGSQTIGEIRARTDRLYPFEDLESVHETLDGLCTRGLIEQGQRQPGQKENRYHHLLTEQQTVHETEIPSAGPVSSPPDQERITQLEEKVALLEEQVAGLRQIIETLTDEC